MNNETYWFSEQVKVIKQQIDQLRKKIRRIRPMWKMMDIVTQRILTQTYVLSRSRYASSIVYPLIS